MKLQTFLVKQDPSLFPKYYFPHKTCDTILMSHGIDSWAFEVYPKKKKKINNFTFMGTFISLNI